MQNLKIAEYCQDVQEVSMDENRKSGFIQTNRSFDLSDPIKLAKFIKLAYVVIRRCAIILGTFLGIFLDCFRIFGHHFVGEIICLGITQIFGYWFGYLINYIAECCLQSSCFLFCSVRFNLFL